MTRARVDHVYEVDVVATSVPHPKGEPWVRLVIRPDVAADLLGSLSVVVGRDA